MKRYWKQFAESATAYAHKPTFALHLGLAFLYAVTGAWLAVWLPYMGSAFSGGGVVAIGLKGLVPLLSVIGIIVSHIVLARFKQTVAMHARLISDVAHDLRNSLAIMKMTGEVHLLREELMSPDESRRFIEGELKELTRMQKTIERLSGHAFAKKRAGRVGV